jgi:hypothetical protein
LIFKTLSNGDARRQKGMENASPFNLKQVGKTTENLSTPRKD